MGLDGDAVEKGARYLSRAFIKTAVIVFFAAMALGMIVGTCARHAEPLLLHHSGVR